MSRLTCTPFLTQPSSVPFRVFVRCFFNTKRQPFIKGEDKPKVHSRMANMAAHPIQTAAEVVGSAGGDPRPMQRTSLFQSANDGPAVIASKITGLSSGGKREDDGPYFTN